MQQQFNINKMQQQFNINANYCVSARYSYACSKITELLLIEREEYCGNNLKNVVQRYFNNSIRGVISTLVRDRKMSDDEVLELINQVIEGNSQE